MASDRLDREFRHVLRRCPRLTDSEVRLLAFVASYSKGCLLTYKEICRLTNWSRSKLIRNIRSLEYHGLIEITHGLYKRTIIRIAPAWRQLEFANASDVSSVTHQSCVSDGADMGHPRNHEVSPMTHSILERELERKIESGDTGEKGSGNVDVQRLIVESFPAFGRKIWGVTENENG